MKHQIIRTNRQRIALANTSRIPTDELVAAIKFLAKQTDLDRTVIHVKKHGRARRWGLAYRAIPSIANLDGLRRHEWRHLITMSDHYAWSIVNGELKRPKMIRLNSEIFHTLAHEARHIADYKHHGRLRGRGWEDRANAFAAGMVRKWEAAG